MNVETMRVSTGRGSDQVSISPKRLIGEIDPVATDSDLIRQSKFGA